MHPGLENFEDSFEKAIALLSEIERDYQGCFLEKKEATTTFHYRNAKQSDHAIIAKLATDVICFCGLVARPAHCAVEAIPPVAWGKGHAVLYILNSLFGDHWYDSTSVFYLGDDLTDENAFEQLNNFNRSVTIHVGATLQQTQAKFRLRNIACVLAFLKELKNRLSAGSKNE